MKKKELKDKLYELPFPLFQDIILAHLDGRLQAIAMDYLKDAEKWEKGFEEKVKKVGKKKWWHEK